MSRNMLSEFIAYLRNPSPVSDETARAISDELQFHLELSVRDGIDNGLNPQQAREHTLTRFGSIEQSFHDCAFGAAEGHVRFHRAHLAVTALLLITAVSLGAWQYLRHSGDTEGPLLTGDILGRVVDENSTPIEGAHVLAVVKTWPEDGFQQKAHTSVTRRDGTFVVADVYPEYQDYEVQLAVLANGRVLESSYFSRQNGQLPRSEFQLHASSPLAVRFEANDGSPVRGVEVFPFQRRAEDGTEDSIYFCSAKPIVRRSDANGQISLPYFSHGDNATVYLKPPGGQWSTHDFAVAEPEQVVVIKMGSNQNKDELASAASSLE